MFLEMQRNIVKKRRLNESQLSCRNALRRPVSDKCGNPTGPHRLRPSISEMIRFPLATVFITVSLFVGYAATGRSQSGASNIAILPNNPMVEMFGRYDGREPDQPRFGYPGGGFLFRFSGTSARLKAMIDSDKGALSIVVDHGAPVMRLLNKGENDVVLADGLEDAAHTVEVYKRTETVQGVLTIESIRLTSGGRLLQPSPLPVRKLMFIGDSVTCGAGIANNSICKPDPLHPANDAYNAYGMVLGRWLDAQSDLVCYGGRGLERDYRGLNAADGVLNAPQFVHLAIASDDPATRASWDVSHWQPDAIIVSLGTNDFNLQKSKPLDENRWVQEYLNFVQALRKDYPHSFILLTEGAMVTDPLLRQMVQETVTRIHNKRVKYVLANHYPGNGCNGHPNRAQHLRMADDLAPVIRRTLGW